MCLVDWLRGSGEKIKDLTKGGKKNNPNCPSRIRHVENLCFCVSILKNITGPCLHSITRHPLSSTCKVTKTACSGDEPKDRAPSSLWFNLCLPFSGLTHQTSNMALLSGQPDSIYQQSISAALCELPCIYVCAKLVSRAALTKVKDHV